MFRSRKDQLYDLGQDLKRRIGYRGAFLMFLVMLNFVYGYSLITDPPMHVNLLLPLNVWAWTWIVMGFILATGVFVKNDRFQFGLSATFKSFWAVAWLGTWIDLGTPRAWINAVIWLSFAALVVVVSFWPEPVPRERIKDLTRYEHIVEDLAIHQVETLNVENVENLKVQKEGESE